MKKLILADGLEDISFKVNGRLTLDITSEGVIVPDDVAAIVKERLGGQVEVKSVDTKEAAKAAAASASADKPKKITADTTEEEDKELAITAGATEEEYAEAVQASTTDEGVDAKALKKALKDLIKAKAA